MPRNEDRVVWHVCNCQCSGWETVYKGRYFWLGKHLGGSWLVSTEHNYRGFHVGKDSRSMEGASRQVQENYKNYPRTPRLSWHRCVCGCSRWSICHKGIRFWGSWNSSIRRATIYRTHKTKQGIVCKCSEVDGVIRRIARRPRRPVVHPPKLAKSA